MTHFEDHRVGSDRLAADGEISADEALSMLDAIGTGQSTPTGADDLKARIVQDLGLLIASVLKLQLEDLSPGRTWMDYGLDSIASTELATLFTEKYGLSLPPTIFFEFQNIDSFADYLLSSHRVQLEKKYSVHLPRLVIAKAGSATPTIPPKHVRPSPTPEGGPSSIEALWGDAGRSMPSATRGLAASPVSEPVEVRSPLDRVIAFPKSTDREPSVEDLRRCRPLVEAAELHGFQRRGGGKLECATFGRGRPLLLLGGLVMHYSVMWQLQLEQWGAEHRLVMFHMPGCGGASLYDGVTLDSLVDDVAQVLEELGIAEAVPVLGYSFGGVLAQAFALRHPARCSALAVCVSTSSADGVGDFRSLMQELQKSPRFMEVNRGWPMAALPTYGRVVEGFDFRSALGRLGMPTLVVSAEDDRYMTPAYSSALSARIPNARLLEFRDAGHLVGFTHHDEFNRAVLDFLAEVHGRRPVHGAEDPSNPTICSDATDETLQLLSEYVRSGEQGHTIMLSPAVAQAALLLDAGLGASKREKRSTRSYFLTSGVEAVDSAFRFARHLARNRSGSSRGGILLVDRTDQVIRHFDPLGMGTSGALVPGIQSVSDLDAASDILAGSDAREIVALAYVADPRDTIEDAGRFLAMAKAASLTSILIDRNDTGTLPSDWLSVRMPERTDIVVLGEALGGFQVPAAAMVVGDNVANPWLMTPNEGYVRHPMANLGFTARVVLEHLAKHLPLDAARVREFRRIASDPEANYEAHSRYGNSGYARVARMHGFDARFYEGRGARSRMVLANRPPRDIVDCLSNVGTCPRGINPLDIATEVAGAHSRERDYNADLRSFLHATTGFEVFLQAPSYVAAIDTALALGLAGSGGRTKIVAFTGGAAFSLASAAVARDALFDSFRTPFQPVYARTVFIDPDTPEARAKLEEELAGGDVALVWLETIQVEGNATRPLPSDLVETVEGMRGSGGYLVAVDETQTALWTGHMIHSARTVREPDIAVLGTALTDGVLPIGGVLTRGTLLGAAYKAHPSWARAAERMHVCQLSAHVALHSLEDIQARGLLELARTNGIYLRTALEALQSRHPIVADVRGEGLLLTIELNLDAQPQFVRQSFGYLLWGWMLRDANGGVATVVCPLHNNCLRLAPPLTITREEIDAIVAGFDRALTVGIPGVLRDCATYCEERGDMRTATYIGGLVSDLPAAISSSLERKTKSEARTKRGGPGYTSVCIVGAGVAGISMAKALKDKNILFECYEARDQLGGIWAYDEEGLQTSTWANLNMNTPKGHYQFADMPMPSHYPDYPNRQQVKDYLEAYVDKNGLRDNIHLGCRVSKATRREDGKWDVVLENGSRRLFDALAVANGHHNEPTVPDFIKNGTFTGTVTHSQKYRTRHEYRGQRVMVVGIGNSGSQIAVDVSHDASMTYLAVRRGVYVLPHYLLGMRIDKALGPLNSWWVKKILRYPLHEMLMTSTYNLFIARHKNIGMPRPDHWMMSCLPTMSENLVNRIGDGKLKIVSDVERAEGKTLHLKDGTSLEVDAIICSTGYRTTFPFLEREIVDTPDNRVQLYKRVFHPEVDNLVFIGLFQAITWGFLDIMERQGQLAAQYFAGEYMLPSVADQKAEIERERARIEREYVKSLRNQYYLHGPTYMREMKLEMRRGQKRMRKAKAPRSFFFGATASQQ